MTRKDRVPPELAIEVFKADGGCVAPKIDPAELGRCWGRLTIEHVKAEQRMGKRAEPRRDRLVSLCLGHTETGMKAGYQWNTAHRPELRAWIADREARIATSRYIEEREALSRGQTVR